MHIPQQGLSKQEVFDMLASFKRMDLDWKSGRVFAYVYNPGQEVSEIVASAYLMYLTENGLDPTTFPSLLKLETDVVRMLANLLRGGESVVGNLTSGGTESILLAVKTARDYTRSVKPVITVPEMILSQTAHPAFLKAAHYFGIKPIVIPFLPDTFQTDVEAMRAAITENTMLLVASAPCYSHGVIDPVVDIAALAKEHNLLCHVDACVGGIHLSFMRKMGYPLPDFDLSVPGVTSISADMHKYGYSAKGASVVLYQDQTLRSYQFFACTETTGYALINPTLLSSKSGGPMAGSWAALNFLGETGYKQIVTEVMETTRMLIDGINTMPDLHVLGKPAMCMFAVASDTINVYLLADEMKKRGWYLQPQFTRGASPRNLHISISRGTTHTAAALLDDLRASVDTVKMTPPVNQDVIKMLVDQLLADSSPRAIQEILSAAGLQGNQMPDETALINEVLDALPPPVADALLVVFFNGLYV